jgi:hypothetical protein
LTALTCASEPTAHRMRPESCMAAVTASIGTSKLHRSVKQAVRSTGRAGRAQDVTAVTSESLLQ